MGEMQLTFRSPDDQEISGKDWFAIWGRPVLPGRDERVYQRLILAAKQGALKAGDFELIGRWKDTAWTEGRWHSRAASVAYNTWKEIAEERPSCPDQDAVAEFLNGWADTLCAYTYGDGSKKKRFGLPRSTTLLHFISSGHYPILDRWVCTALRGIAPGTSLGDDGRSYLETFDPLFRRIAAACGTDDVRRLDQDYGGFLSERQSTNF